LIKLSRAADPWSSSLAVFYKQDGIFFIWGLVDQTVHFNTMLVRETTSGYAPPGLFQVVATGTADLTVYREYRFVGRLAQDTLVTSQNDVFELGPIRERLFDGIERYWDAVLRRIRALQPVDGDDVAYLGDRWVGTLCRLLISIQRYRHGGALLIGTSRSGLDVKYAIDYGRLSAALTNLGVATIVRARTADHISDVYLDKDKNSLPVDLYLDEAMAQDDADDLEQEITGCVRFISSLSCVDGAILATPELRIRGFGVEILTKKDAEAVYLSLKPNVHPKSVRAVDPNHYGMRHRSMMRYCFWHPRSLGFVVSQDGEIRAMTRVEDRLVMWENLQVHWLWESRRSRVQSGGRSGAAPTG
jgi:hypothetical protein